MSNQSTLNEFGGSDTNGQLAGSDPGDEKLYRNEEWLQEQYWEQEKTLRQIADKAGVSQKTITNWMDKHEIERRGISEARTDGDVEPLKNEEWLRKQYYEQEKSADKIADERDVHKTTVIAWMKKHDIERRSSGRQADGDTEPLKDEEWLRERYCEQEKSTCEIANKLGLSKTTVRKRMDEHGIERRSLSEARTDGNLELLKNEEWLREQYCDKQKTVRDIADELSLSSTAVRNQMDEHGIERRSSAESLANGDIEQLRDEDWLREQYYYKEKTTHEIANKLDLSVNPVMTSMKKHGIERRGMSEARTDGDIELVKDEQWLREQYCEQQKATRQIADELGLAKTTVLNWMGNHGIERRSPPESHTDGDIESLKDEEWLRKQYHHKHKTMCEIADELDLGATTVGRAMKKHEIERRGMSEARTDGDVEPLKNEEWLRERYCEQRKSTYQIANKLDLSQTTVRKWLDIHDIEIRSSVMHPDHLPHRVIGELELDIANLLNDAGVDYTYESREIEYGEGRRYTPDFVTEDYVIECKGADWGKKYDKGYTAEQKAEAIMKQLDEREYVVVGIQLPCDIHIPREEHGTIQELFE